MVAKISNKCLPGGGPVIKVLAGGFMLGDTFHLIPFLNLLMDLHSPSKIVWVSGDYAKAAVEFLQLFYPIEPIFYPDTSPPESLTQRYSFRKKYLRHFDEIPADIEYSNCVEESFDVTRSQPRYKPEMLILRNQHLLEHVSEDSLLVHPCTIHNWKGVPAFKEIEWSQFGLKVYSVGLPSEYLVPNSIDFRGQPFVEVARKIKASRLTVAIHSAVACLTMYLDEHAIVCAPGEDKCCPFLLFSEYKCKMVDIAGPSGGELTEAIWGKLSSIDDSSFNATPSPSQPPPKGEAFEFTDLEVDPTTVLDG